jgi:hypothetical protein
MGILKRRRKGSESDDEMWLDPDRVEQPPSVQPVEEPAPPQLPTEQLPPAPPPPIPVEVTPQPEENTLADG